MLKIFGLMLALSTGIAFAQDNVWYTIAHHGSTCISLADASRELSDINAPWKEPEDLLKSVEAHGITLTGQVKSPDETTMIYEFATPDEHPLSIFMVKGRGSCEEFLRVKNDMKLQGSPR